MIIGDGVVVLRPWAQEDEEALWRVCQDPEIQRWIPHLPAPYSQEDAAAFIAQAGPEQWAVTVDDELAGSMDIARQFWDVGHLGYWCADRFRRRGLTTRALRLIAPAAFRDMGFARLEMLVDVENTASRRVAEKAGFTAEGTLRSVIRWRDGSRRDALMMSLLPGDPT
jgi:RimJ/RimL family protein N-acetyltransferase